MPNVTKRQAERVLAAVIAQNKVYCEPLLAEDGSVLADGLPLPVLVQDWQSWSSVHPWAILWEEGPSEWAYRVHDGGRTEEERVLLHQAAQEFGVPVPSGSGPAPVVLPAGVWAEPITSYALGIYPA